MFTFFTGIMGSFVHDKTFFTGLITSCLFLTVRLWHTRTRLLQRPVVGIVFLLGCYGLLEFRFLGNPQLSVIDVSSNFNEVPLVVLLPVDQNYQVSVLEACGSIPVSSCSVHFLTVKLTLRQTNRV